MARVRVKICGITSIEDARAAVEAGADALGFLFAPSPRRVTPEQAAAIVSALPPFVTTVGVLVDQDPAPILEVCPLDAIQFHGAESPEMLQQTKRVRKFKAFRIRDAADLEAIRRYHGVAEAILLDAYVASAAGGTGTTFPWELAREATARGLVASRTTLGSGPPLILAGGLTPENVAEAIAATDACAVDVSSGVEAAPGRKDEEKVRRFILQARGSCDDARHQG
jgi:phosphoribosylanthranilate isomerase